MHTAHCTLTYNMADLGGRVFNFERVEQAEAYLQQNPPELTDLSVYLDDHREGLRHITYNTFFCPGVYAYALREKQWEDGYYRRTGRHWKEHPREADTAELDREACLRLLGLEPGFTPSELATAYRVAIKMNHPDKVAALADEFKTLAEARTKLINQAYSTLRVAREA